MSSVRLTTILREDILDRAVTGAYDEESDAVDRRDKAVGDAVYRLLVPEEAEKQMKKLPVGFMATGDDFQLTAFAKPRKSGQYGSRRSYSLSTERRLPKFFDGYGLELVVGVELMKEIEAVDAEYERVRVLRKDLKAKVRAILNSVTTVSRLLEVWPESDAFLPDYAKNPKLSNLPAVLVGEVNVLLGEAKHEVLTEAIAA